MLLLNEIARELTSILNLDELLKRVGELLSRLIDFQMFSILLIDDAGEKLQHRFSLRFQENIQLKNDIPIGKGIVGCGCEEQQAVLVTDVKKDPRYIETNPETRSELAVPLIYKDKVIGVLDLEHTQQGFFTEDHQRTITTLAAQIAIAIENARLYEADCAPGTAAGARSGDGARVADSGCCHSRCRKLAHLEIAAKFSPARTIGGDLYDFLVTRNRGTALVIGDVSGKGAPAAIYAGVVSGIMRSHAPMEPAPAEMLAAVNYSLAERRIDAQFVSLIYGIWDDASLTLQVANSGLPRPVYCHKGKTQLIEATGLPLGLFEDAEYDEFVFQAEPDDIFVFFSDGILDATNRKGELFGRTRLEKIIAECASQSAESIVKSIFKAAADHASGVETFDDQTVVAIKVKGSTPPRT